MIENNHLENDVEITCQHRLMVSSIKDINSEINFGFILYEFPDWMEVELGNIQVLDYLKLANAQIAHLPINLANRNIMNSIHQIGIKVHIACNEHKEKIGQCYSLKADQFSTNFLDEAINIRNTI